MVTNHCLPGKIIPFAAPLFTFLVGYGYEFAKQKNLRHAAIRIWHLLINFWFILFGLCVPIAIFYTHYKFTAEQLIMNMFGLWPGFNYYCWYVYFYILAMLCMPWLSRLIDRYGLRALIPMVILFLGVHEYLHFNSGLLSDKWIERLNRFCELMPIVVTAYWLAHYKIFSKIHIKYNGISALLALIVISGVYLMRYFQTVKLLDFINCAVFSAAIAVLFDSVATLGKSAALLTGKTIAILTDLGIKSMYIWFIHSIFIAHSTRSLFKFMEPLYKYPVSKVLTILLTSWLLSILLMRVYNLLSSLISKAFAKLTRYTKHALHFVK